MGISKKLAERSGSVCELCGSTEGLSAYEVQPAKYGNEDDSVVVCATCSNQIENADAVEANHWRCLNDSMWSEVPAVQAMAWRMLTRLKAEGWPQDLLDMLYLDEETLAWAKASGVGEVADDKVVHRDSNGVILETGDTVVLIKDLPVKGSSMVAKRGTAVRKISLVYDNAEHIEGKVDGIQIVILTKFVKKM
ncbi:MAG: PhnA domain-containing protein [Lutibacter sp.]|nr:PhnA domain-containing protein [Lutibacter sp.]